MQFSIIAMLGLSAFAVAAPAAQPVSEALPLDVPVAGLEVRNSGTGTYCCPQGSKYNCRPCPNSESCQQPNGQGVGGEDTYSGCSGLLQLINVQLCDILNGNSILNGDSINIL